MRVVGMIGVTPPSSAATLHVIEGGLSPNYVAEAARAHEASGFDLVLVGYSSSSAEGFLVALHAAARTERLGYLIAHRPGFVAPTLMRAKSRPSIISAAAGSPSTSSLARPTTNRKATAISRRRPSAIGAPPNISNL
jgi:hypothetical protein